MMHRLIRRPLAGLFYFFLRGYRRGESGAFQKARVQLILLLFAGLVLPIFLIHNYILFSQVSFYIAVTVITGCSVLLVLLYFLRAGRHLVSGNLFLLLISGLLWYWMFMGSASPLNRLDTITLVVAAMIMAPLLTNGSGLYLQQGLNGVCLFLFIAFNPAAGELPPNALRSYALDTSVAVLLAAITSHLFLRTSNRIQRETELTNRNLRTRVHERTEQLNRVRDLLSASRDELQRDMDMARNVQRDLLLREMPSLREWEIAHYFRPASRVSGDFYDVYTHDGELRGLALFDVSGHGVGSGLITMLARSIMLRRFHRSNGQALGRIMEEVNSELIHELSDVNNYITGILTRYVANRVEIVNAGHCDALHRPRSGASRALAQPNRAHKGTVLGLGALEAPYPVMELEMQAGEMLLFYTDGIIECENRAGEQYGEKRLRDALDFATRGDSMDARAVLASLERDRDNFTSGRPGQDDETMLLLLKT